jgi:Na+-driven multidrug efflux pump
MRNEIPIPSETNNKDFLTFSTWLAALQEIGELALPIATRAGALACRAWLKRYIVSQSDSLPDYAKIIVIERLLFDAIFAGQRIISIKTTQADSKDSAKVGQILQHGFLNGMYLITFFLSPVVFVIPQIYTYTNQPDTVIAKSKPYLLGLLAAFSVDILYRTQSRVLLGLKKPWVPLVTDLFQGVIDISLAWLLIPFLGLTACTISYFFASIASTLMLSGYLYFSGIGKEYALFQRHPFDPALQREITLKSTQAVLSVAAENMGQLVLTAWCLNQESAASAEIAKSYGMLVNYFMIGFSASSSIIIAKKLREKQFWQITAYTNYIFTVTLCALTGITLFIFAKPYADIFSTKNSPASQANDATAFIRTQVFIELFNGIKQVSTSTMEAHTDNTTPFIINAGFLFIFQSILSLLAKFFLHATDPMIFLTQNLAYGCAAVSHTAYLRFRLFEKGEPDSQRVVKSEPTLDDVPMKVVST